jgi:glycerophosphoryl diester phosphodiesterase
VLPCVGLFEVPTLTELFELIQDWHTNIDPLLINSTTVRSQRGVYAELKDYPWLLQDAGIDLVDLLFQHMQENQELWETVVMTNLCSTKRLKIHDLRLPPLILQSFEAKVLQSFTEQWETRFIGNSSSDTTDNPVPPTILLVPREKCLDDNFWFQVDDTWRDFLSGLGPDKECLLQNWREFMEHAAKLGLVVHPWTERPELEYIGGDTSAFSFESVLDELTFLFCTVGVHGVFSESVEVAVLAASIACPEASENSAPTTILPEGRDPHPDSGNTLCYETDEEANLYVGLASFTLGVFLTVVIGLFVNKRQQRRERRPIQIPTVETTDDDDDDHEML